MVYEDNCFCDLTIVFYGLVYMQFGMVLFSMGSKHLRTFRTCYSGPWWIAGLFLFCFKCSANDVLSY